MTKCDSLAQIYIHHIHRRHLKSAAVFPHETAYFWGEFQWISLLKEPRVRTPFFMLSRFKPYRISRELLEMEVLCLGTLCGSRCQGNNSLCFHSKLQLYLKPGSQVYWGNSYKIKKKRKQLYFEETILY